MVVSVEGSIGEQIRDELGELRYALGEDPDTFVDWLLSRKALYERRGGRNVPQLINGIWRIIAAINPDSDEAKILVDLKKADAKARRSLVVLIQSYLAEEDRQKLGDE